MCEHGGFWHAVGDGQESSSPELIHVPSMTAMVVFGQKHPKRSPSDISLKNSISRNDAFGTFSFA